MIVCCKNIHKDLNLCLYETDPSMVDTFHLSFPSCSNNSILPPWVMGG